MEYLPFPCAGDKRRKFHSTGQLGIHRALVPVMTGASLEALQYNLSDLRGKQSAQRIIFYFNCSQGKALSLLRFRLATAWLVALLNTLNSDYLLDRDIQYLILGFVSNYVISI